MSYLYTVSHIVDDCASERILKMFGVCVDFMTKTWWLFLTHGV